MVKVGDKFKHASRIWTVNIIQGERCDLSSPDSHPCYGYKIAGLTQANGWTPITPTIKPDQVWRYNDDTPNVAGATRTISSLEGAHVFFKEKDGRDRGWCFTNRFLTMATLVRDVPEHTHRWPGGSINGRKHCLDCGDPGYEMPIVQAGPSLGKSVSLDPVAADRAVAVLMEQRNAEFHDRHKQAIKDAWAATSQTWSPPDTGSCRWQRRRG